MVPRRSTQRSQAARVSRCDHQSGTASLLLACPPPPPKQARTRAPRPAPSLLFRSPRRTASCPRVPPLQHIYGGIPPSIVIEERAVSRAADGSYLSIAGLVDQLAPPPTAPHNIGRVLAAAAAVVCLVGLTRAALRR